MIHKALHDIDRADLQALIDDAREEGRTLDYKRDLTLANDQDKRELARDVSSFANAAGGDLIFGIDEAQGVPIALVGVACANFDQTKQRIESIVRDTLDPRVPGIGIHKVDGNFPNGPVIVVRVQQSWSGPHMVAMQNQTHFYSRNTAGKYPLDVREIGGAFLARNERATRIQRFRDERVGRIVAGETPIPLTSDGACVVVHLVPLGGVPIDLAAVENDAAWLRPPGAMSINHRYNLDGVFGFPAGGGRQSRYVQVFRDGASEGVAVGYMFPRGNGAAPDAKELFPLLIEGVTVALLEQFQRGLARGGYDGPAAAMVTIFGVRGARIGMTGGMHRAPWNEDATFDRDTLALPDVLVERMDSDPREYLRPTFDAMWQAGGLARSLGYEGDAWRADTHP